MLLLARSVYRHPNRRLVESKLFTLRKQTQLIKEVMRRCIDVENPSEILLCMYWYEFKRAREDFKTRYNTAIRLFEENLRNTAPLLFHELRPNDQFDKELAKENMVSAVVNLLRTNIAPVSNYERCGETSTCNICMNGTNNACLVHENRACAICKECSKWFQKGKRCPFCRKIVERVVRLNGT